MGAFVKPRFTILGLFAITLCVGIVMAVLRRVGVRSFVELSLVPLHAMLPLLLWLAVRPFSWECAADRFEFARKLVIQAFWLLPIAATIVFGYKAVLPILVFHFVAALFFWTPQYMILAVTAEDL